VDNAQASFPGLGGSNGVSSVCPRISSPLLNPFSDVTLTVQVNGPTAPPGGPGTGNIIFQSPVSCSVTNCIQKSADYTNAADLPYSAPNMWGGQNSNWWASNTTSACGLSVNYPWNAIGAN
jgi:hypothetical protein